MPRRADHTARRKQLADALMGLAATQGLEQVSLRHVAAEAGVSTGMVQHYFRTKDEMMAFAREVVMDNIRARATVEVVQSGPDPTPKTAIRILLMQILPLDHTRRLECHVMLAFLAYAAVKPGITAGLRDGSNQLRAHVAAQIGRAQAEGNPVLRIDPELAATNLLALVEGLGLQLLGQHYPVETALAVLDAQLTALFGEDQIG